MCVLAQVAQLGIILCPKRYVRNMHCIPSQLTDWLGKSSKSIDCTCLPVFKSDGTWLPVFKRKCTYVPVFDREGTCVPIFKRDGTLIYSSTGF